MSGSFRVGLLGGKKEGHHTHSEFEFISYKFCKDQNVVKLIVFII